MHLYCPLLYIDGDLLHIHWCDVSTLLSYNSCRKDTIRTSIGQTPTFAITCFFMKSFNVPTTYRSPLISAIKMKRKQDDKLKKDFTPTCLDFGNMKIFLARHFGFCYGVENAIDIAYKTIEENQLNSEKKIQILQFRCALT